MLIPWAGILSTSYMPSSEPRNKYTLFHIILAKRLYDDLPWLFPLYTDGGVAAGLRLKKVKWLTQKHTTSELWSWVSVQCDFGAQAYHHFVTPPTHDILDFAPKTVEFVSYNLLENSGRGEKDQ